MCSNVTNIMENHLCRLAFPQRAQDSEMVDSGGKPLNVISDSRSKPLSGVC